mmetsp:Transcript_7057/g.13101  ORF Transcript_7057/g.13101 Transcript_7057/m.13101 type:complete len:572 (-) Transcript_7057:42-1757(-)
MEDDLLAAWAAQDPNDRESSMRLEDPEIVRLIETCMRQLQTAAEIQACQQGTPACVQQFDGTQLPLLASIKFDGTVVIKWPRSFCDDMAIMRSVLQNAGGRRPARRPLKRQQWHQLLQPPAVSWRDFERQLAQLVEQLVLSVRAEHGRKVASKSEEQGSADESTQIPGAARAAKRARQRERRRLGKAAAAGNMPSTLDNGSGAGAPATIEVDGAQELMAAANSAGCTATSAELAPPVATPVVVECGIASTSTTAGANASVLGEGSNGSLAGKAQRSRVRTPLEAIRKQPPFEDVAHAQLLPQLHDSEPMRVVLADTPVSVSGEMRAEGALQDGSSSFLQLAADDSGEVSARGIGRGRPMGEQQGPWYGPPGKSMGMDAGMGPVMGPGMGRGRVLAPPPGLRGPHRQEKIPHGLSKPWMATPIPEEDDEGVMTPQQLWTTPLQDDTWMYDLSLPESAMGSSGSEINTPSYAIKTPSCWDSYRHTPAHTPAREWSHPPSPREAHVVGQAAAAASLAVMGAGVGNEHLSPAASPGLNRSLYAFVPIAMAQTCPHCGERFALPADAALSSGVAVA